MFSGLYDSDPVVRMRSADVIEKVTKNKPELLSGYTSQVISILASAEQQEVCWHMAQVVPRLECTANEENEIIEALKRYLLYKSKIVIVSAMESLTIFTERKRKPSRSVTRAETIATTEKVFQKLTEFFIRNL